MRMLTRLQQQFGKAEGRSHGQSDEAAKSPAPTIQYQRQQQSGWQLGRAGEREGHEHRSRDQFERVHVAVEGYHRQGPGTLISSVEIHDFTTISRVARRARADLRFTGRTHQKKISRMAFLARRGDLSRSRIVALSVRMSDAVRFL